MSESAYKSHPIHGLLKQVLESQDDEELTLARSTLSEDQSWQFDRVFAIARLIESLLSNTPSGLISISSLNNINSYLQQAANELSNFRANKNAGHVSNASSHVDNIIPQLSGLSGGLARLPDSAIGQLFDDIRTRSSTTIHALKQEKDALSNKIAELTALITAQEQKIAELSTAVETQKKEAIAVASEVRTAYNKTETELRKEFDNSLATMRQGYSEFETISKQSADDTLANLKRKEEEAKQIVQVVGNVGVTGNYKNIANIEGDAANRMRWATIAFFGAGVVIAFVSLAAHLFPDFSPIAIAPAGPWELVLRLVTALAVAAPAFYTARESARHRTNSDRARQRELELASLGPFIELLPEATRQDIVKKMTDRYFGTEVEPHEAKTILSAKDVSNFLTQLNELVATAKK